MPVGVVHPAANWVRKAKFLIAIVRALQRRGAIEELVLEDPTWLNESEIFSPAAGHVLRFERLVKDLRGDQASSLGFQHRPVQVKVYLDARALSLCNGGESSIVRMEATNATIHDRERSELQGALQRITEQIVAGVRGQCSNYSNAQHIQIDVPARPFYVSSSERKHVLVRGGELTSLWLGVRPQRTVLSPGGNPAIGLTVRATYAVH
jgi:hypothetical protein